MKRLFLYSTIAFLTVATVATGFAKDKKKDKDKDKDKDRDRTVYVERDGRRFYADRDGKRQWIDDDRNYRSDGGDSRGYGYGRDRTRTIYVVERNRPVERVVYVDPDGRYYRWADGRRSYVTGRYYESYPSRYYYPDGRPRITITLPF